MARPDPVEDRKQAYYRQRADRDKRYANCSPHSSPIFAAFPIFGHLHDITNLPEPAVNASDLGWRRPMRAAYLHEVVEVKSAGFQTDPLPMCRSRVRAALNRPMAT
jgi:hypothetical protein